MVPDVDKLSSRDPLELTRVQIPELPQEVLLALSCFAGTACLSHAAVMQGQGFESQEKVVKATSSTPTLVRLEVSTKLSFLLSAFSSACT